MCSPVVVCLLVDVLLNILEQVLDVVDNAFICNIFLGESIAAGNFPSVVFVVVRTNGETNRNSLHFPFGKLESRALSVAVVVLVAYACSLKLSAKFVYTFRNHIELLISLVNRNDNYLNWSQMRRQYKSVVVGVSHNERTHQTGRNAPRSCPYIFGLVFLVKEGNIECLCEILCKEVRSTCLQCLSVLHESLNTESFLGTGKALAVGLAANNNGNAKVIFNKIGIYMNHLVGFFHCFLLGCVSGMTFLPQEFGSTQEQTGTHFPTHYVRPLVHKDRQVAVRLYPVAVGVPNYSFGGRANNEFFLELCLGIYFDSRLVGIGAKTVMSYNCALLCKTFNMVGFAAEKRLWNKQREICVCVTSFLEHFVKNVVHFFPYRITVRLDNHTSSNCGLFRQICLNNKLVVPLRIILRSLCQLCHFILV